MRIECGVIEGFVESYCYNIANQIHAVSFGVKEIFTGSTGSRECKVKANEIVWSAFPLLSFVFPVTLTFAGVRRPRPRFIIVGTRSAGGCGVRPMQAVVAQRAYRAGRQRGPCISAVVPHWT